MDTVRSILNISPFLTLAAVIAVTCAGVALFRWIGHRPIRGFVFFGVVALAIALSSAPVRQRLFGG